MPEVISLVEHAPGLRGGGLSWDPREISSGQQSVAGPSTALPSNVCVTSLHKQAVGAVVAVDWGVTLAVWGQP